MPGSAGQYRWGGERESADGPAAALAVEATGAVSPGSPTTTSGPAAPTANERLLRRLRSAADDRSLGRSNSRRVPAAPGQLPRGATAHRDARGVLEHRSGPGPRGLRRRLRLRRCQRMCRGLVGRDRLVVPDLSRLMASVSRSLEKAGLLEVQARHGGVRRGFRLVPPVAQGSTEPHNFPLR